MSKLLNVTEASKLIVQSLSTLRRDIAKGKISVVVDERGNKRIDPAELSRVYEMVSPNDNDSPVNTGDQSQNGSMDSVDAAHNGSMTQPAPHENGSMNSDDTRVIEMLESQISDLKSQISAEKSEKSKLLELADRLQKQNELLMLPKPKPRGSILNYFRLRR